MDSTPALPRTRTHRALLSDDVVSSVLSFLAAEAGRAVDLACKMHHNLWRRRCAGLFRVRRSPVGDFWHSEQVTAYGDGAVVANYGDDDPSMCLKTYSARGDHLSDLLVGIHTPTAVALRGDGTAWVLLSDDDEIHCMRLDDPTCSVIMEITPDRFYPDSRSCRVCDIGLAGDRLLILSYSRYGPEQVPRVHVVDNRTGSLLYQFLTHGLLRAFPKCFAVQDDMLYVAGYGTGAIHTYNWRQGSREGMIRLGGELAFFSRPIGVAVSGKMLCISEQGKCRDSTEDVPGRIWILRLANDVSSDATVVQVIPSPDGAELGGLCLNGGQLWCMGPDEQRTHMHLLGPCY
jgi:hypothetical protein